jgi:hypothetical protein
MRFTLATRNREGVASFYNAAFVAQGVIADLQGRDPSSTVVAL